MRMRKKKNQEQRVLNCSHIMITAPEEYKGKWNSLFGNDNPIHIEIGCGKGKFINEMATINPEINYLAIERDEAAMLSAMEKAKDANLKNLYFLNFDASKLTDIFENAEISQIYLNFSDPWPPKRYGKRRLTHENFLNQYKLVLISEGEIHFKTDNQGLFEFSLSEICRCGWLLNSVSPDLHTSTFEGNIMTEYETKFTQLGQRIYRLEAKKRD